MLNVACSTSDPLGVPSLSAAQPEMTPQTPFTSVPDTEENSVPPLSPAQTPTPSTPLEPTGNLPTEPLGTIIPVIPTDEPDNLHSGTETPVEVVVSRATCTSTASDMQQRMLHLINEARATERICGQDTYSATRALQWNAELGDAAQGHSLDMATHNFFDHSGSDGSSASARVTDEGYRWRTVGENIAAGRETAEQTLNDWLESPGHCRNIMNPSFTEVAVACVENNDSDYKRYWTNVLAAPQ